MPNDLRQRPYKLYRAGPRGLKALLRGEEDGLLEPRDYRKYRGSGGRRGEPSGRRITPKRVIIGLIIAVVGWLLLSFVLFMISAQVRSSPSVLASAQSQLSSGGPMLTSANTVLILGLDNRASTGSGSKEPGANFSETDANTDTIMLWRIGGGVSRRLSIPRDTLVNIPGHGQAKINAAWAEGGPALALQTIKQFTGLQINHVVVIDLGNFPKFINDIGGVTVSTGRICSSISGGAANGGFTLNLSPGTHHLNGEQALILARTRENACNAASNDLTREAAQQQILNSIKSQLLTVHTFLHLPWAAWDAPGVLQTDMGGLTLLQMFVASEIGGSAPPSLLSESGETYNGEDVLIPNQANVQAQVQKLLHG
jgi:LCP family protein required for cell wall assembly